MHPLLLTLYSGLAGAAALTAYAGVYPRSELFGPTVAHTNSPKKLALTFDDGPNPELTPRLLDLLDKHNAKASFFLVGKFVRDCPWLAKEISARGHLIGNHTDTHPNLFFCGPSETREEIERCTAAIEHATFETPRWFRPPFGMRSLWTGDIAHHLGMRVAMWTQIPGDWRGKPAAWLVNRMSYIGAVSGKPSAARTNSGHILCLHDGDFQHQGANREHTLLALQELLPRWRDAGLEFVTMSAAAGESAG